MFWKKKKDPTNEQMTMHKNIVSIKSDLSELKRMHENLHDIMLKSLLNDHKEKEEIIKPKPKSKRKTKRQTTYDILWRMNVDDYTVFDEPEKYFPMRPNGTPNPSILYSRIVAKKWGRTYRCHLNPKNKLFVKRIK